MFFAHAFLNLLVWQLATVVDNLRDTRTQHILSFRHVLLFVFDIDIHSYTSSFYTFILYSRLVRITSTSST